MNRTTSLNRQPGQRPVEQRRGVALLFVISLIVVFFLFATTFVAMSTSYMRTSDRKLRTERTDQLKVVNVVDDVFYMLLRDVSGNHILRGHSLLGDQYGVEPFVVNDASGAFTGTCDFVAVDAGYAGQVLRVQLTANLQPGATPASISALVRASRDDFLGRFLTFADGPLAGVTMPILEYKFRLLGANPIIAPDNVECHFFVLVQPQERNWSFDVTQIGQMAGARFVINGRPFDGTVTESNEPFDVVSDDSGVLLQNRNFFLARDARGSAAFPPQFQQVPSFHRYAGFTPANTGNDLNLVTWQALRDLSSFALRPSPLENPNFTGSNPNARFFTPGTYGNAMRTPNFIFPTPTQFAENGFNSAAVEHWQHLVWGMLGNDPSTLNTLNLPLNAGLDVDTDGDGVNDAIWIDIGLAPVAMPNGTRVKPLVAIKIEDLDGRLNLNAHGSLAELARNFSGAPLSPNNVPFGQGYGPAEIPLTPVLGPANFQLVLQSRYGLPVGGGPGVGSPDMPGLTNAVHAARWFGFLDNILPNLSGGLYGTASDYQGQLVFHHTGVSVLPGFGVPMGNPGMVLPFAQTGSLLGTQILDSPYEFNLFAEGSPYRYYDYSTIPPTPVAVAPNSPEADQPFNVSDLETLLRAFDADSTQTLAAALNLRSQAAGGPQNRRQIQQQLLDGIRTNELVRRQVTTHSFEVPALPANLAGVLRRHLLLRNDLGALVDGHYQQDRALLTPSGLTNVAWGVEEQVLAMLGQEIVSGLPLNLHRKFGNGRDDNGSLMLDDYGDPLLGGGVESSLPQSAVTVDVLAGTPIDLDFDRDGNIPSSGDGDQFIARSAFARQLYVLMLMMVEPNYALATSQLTPEIIRRRIAIAQWAINAVEFMDADSICTPFEFDINPFNGWHVDGNLRTRPDGAGGLVLGIEDPVVDPYDAAAGPQLERYVVWGLERPDLLLTEAGGFHDHRTHIQGMNMRQGHMPNPSAFIELYNPNLIPFTDYQSQADTHASLTPLEKGVNLQKVTPGGDPVFRLLVVKERDRGLNPDHLISAFDAMSQDHEVGGNQRRFAQGGINDIERTIYFVNPLPLINRIDQYVATNSVDLNTDPLRVQLAKGLVQHFPSIPGDPLAGGFIPFVLQPGHNAVIGSAGPHNQNALTRNTTIFGRIVGAATDNTYDPAIDSLDRPAIRLNPGAPIEVGYFDTGNPGLMRLVPNTIGIPMDQVEPATPEYRSFAISGPITGYPVVDAAGDPAEPEVDGWRYNAIYNNPFHQDPLFDLEIARYGQIEDFNDPGNPTYRHVVLQRLANPQQIFHPEYNPYLTMDDIGMGLNGFGGLGEDADLTNAAIGPMLAMMQRGRTGGGTQFAHTVGAPALINNVERKNVWLRTPSGNWESPPIPGTNNGTFPVAVTNYDTINGYVDPAPFSFGQVNQAYLSQANVAVPWLRIANRPLISQFELASVPVQSNALLLEHAIWTNPQAHNHYTDDALLNSAANAGLRNNGLFPDLLDRVSPYLLNFYGQTVAMRAPARMFEFTSVPSPFVGTETLLNPVARANGGFGLDLVGVGGTTPLLSADGPRYSAPYNWLSNRRVPGKLNLNTVHYPATWTSLMPGAYGNPTNFANFVLATHGQFNPLRHMSFSQFDPADPDSDFFRRLRMPRSTGSPPAPFYNLNANLWMPIPGGGVPFFDHNNNSGDYDTQRNEYFRLQKRQRMANLTTQRSSVFAVWITVGYFELEEVAIPIPDNPNAPLNSLSFGAGNVEIRTAVGREYGLDRGRVRRDRAFYVVDRSIPVGFFPGENLNVDQAVLTRRYLP